MRVVGPYRTSLDCLYPMARDWSRASLEEVRPDGGDSEESLEEISAEDFKRDAGSSVWMGYSMPRNYASNLYNIAWAQAVQNKPFTESMPTRAGDLASGKDRASSVVAEDSSEYGGTEKEEGELEEGEIGFGLDMMDNEEATNGVASDEQENQSGKGDSDMKGKIEETDDFDKRVSLILEELESVTEEEAAASFETVCLRLRKSFENLKPMFSGVERSDTVLDALVQQAFLGIQTVHYQVLNSNDVRTKELNKDLLLRLLVHIKNQYSKLLTSQQICEIDAWLNYLVFEDRNKAKKLPGDSRHVVNNNAPPFEDRCPSDLEKQSFISSYSNGNNVKSVLSKFEVSSLARGRGPLLDLHADYDENSLPSPTRDNPPQYPMPKPIGYVEGPVTYSQPIIPKRTEEKEPMLHSYAKDAVKAVSSYQQKWTSIPTINRLPSPTPSEEGNIGGDTLGEISSSLNPKNANLISSSSYFQTPKPICSGLYTNGAMTDHLGRNKLTMKGAPVANHVVKPTAKSRDPRLRLMNPEVTGSLDQIGRTSVDPDNINYGLMEGIQNNNKKHRHLDDSSPEDYSSKRPRNDFTRSKDMHSMSGRGGWLEDGNFVATQPSKRIRPNNNSEFGNKKSGHEEDGFDRGPDATADVPNSTVKQNPAFDPSDISLPSLLKIVDPTILKQLLEVEKGRLSAENQQKKSVAFSSTSASLSVSNEVGQNPPGKPQILLSSVPVIPQIRMKPRDPRRILHSNTIRKSENLISGQTRNGVSSSTQSSTDHMNARESREQAQKSNLYSQSIIAKPHISHQVATNPKHIASIVSSSQKANPPSSLPISIKRDQPDVKVSAAEGNDPKESSSVVSEASSACTSKLKNLWGDVEHLLDGYDDEQKVAIQKERARRISEQNKMFAARKLCLVLDLDHTLLNSAKFVEIDPAHEDILRKKEEQDRERPQRHLYRFLHMGMWTKLRPGIWNFLDKASKLFELHLYTMGNKLYATEMAKILDPTGMLFSGRVLSRGDDSEPLDGDERVPKSKDLDGVLGMESAVVIIDDSVRVWPHNRLNLIVVERYTYFPCSRRQFGLPGPSLLEIDHDERPEDGTLASSLAVIERIHQFFFSHDSLNDVDVRNILASEQHKILAGCRILFSRIFPVGEANPHLHPLWQTAEQFGAVCTNQIDEQVTHVVANCLGTDKVNWALATGRYVVQPGWVEASTLLYRRANEHDFAVKIQ